MSNTGSGNYIEKISIIPRKNDSISSVNELLRREVEMIIITVSDKRSIPALINLLDDHELDIRWIAAESLIRIGRKSIIPLLVSIRDGRIFSYPGKAHHVLQCLLTKSEKKALKPLLASLSGNPGENARPDIQASFALKRIFRFVN